MCKTTEYTRAWGECYHAARVGAGGSVGGGASVTAGGSRISKEDIESRLLGALFENQVANVTAKPSTLTLNSKPQTLDSKPLYHKSETRNLED